MDDSIPRFLNGCLEDRGNLEWFYFLLCSESEGTGHENNHQSQQHFPHKNPPLLLIQADKQTLQPIRPP
jgi:hypothetical protein